MRETETTSRDLDKLTEIQDFNFQPAKGKIKSENLNKLKALEVRPETVLNFLMVALSEKRAGNISGKFSSTEEVENLKQTLSDIGLNLVTGSIEVGNGVVTDIYFSKKNISTEDVKEIKPAGETPDIENHRKSGHFYGVPEPDLNYFLEERRGIANRLRWKMSQRFQVHGLVNSKLIPSKTANASKLIEKFGQDLEEEEKRRIKALTFHVAENSEKGLERIRNQAEERFQKLEEIREEYGIDFTEEIEKIEKIDEESNSD